MAACALLSATAPAHAGAQEERAATRVTCEERIWMNEDGSARLDAVLTVPPGVQRVRIPAGGGAPEGIDITSAPGARAAAAELGDGILVELAPATMAITLHVQAFLPRFDPQLASPPGAHGNRTLRYRGANTNEQPMTMRTEILLPASYVVAAVVASEPAETDTAAAFPFAVIERDGRAGASIADDAVETGRAVAITVRYKQRVFPSGLLAALALIAVVYLWAFRDLATAPPETAPAPALRR